MAYLSLAEFIDKERAVIMERWESFARTLLPAAASMSSRRLRDHGEEILTAIVRDLHSPQTPQEQQEKSEGEGEEKRIAAVGKIHANLRAADGFSIGQLAAELRALRASVLNLWEQELNGIDPHGITRFNEAIDEVLIEAVENYEVTVEQARNQFIGILGHDLRTPLSTVLMGLSFLSSTNTFDEDSTHILESMKKTSERMSRMINDILDLARTRSGFLLAITPQPMNLAKMCQEVCEEFKILTPSATIHFIQTGKLEGVWDYDRLAQVLSNLIGNALQYGAPHEPITITAKGTDDEVTILVRNAGGLIPAATLAVIFEAGTHHVEKHTRSSGLGLGLFISKQLIIAHGGDIEVTSTAAEGTKFTVRLPRVRVK